MSSPITTQPQSGGMNSRQEFNRNMKEIDSLLRLGKAAEANSLLLKTKSLDPGNPYIRAFEERIAELAKSPRGARPAAGHHSPSFTPRTVAHEPIRPASVHSPSEPATGSRAELESKLREEIENEYRERFTNQLRLAKRNTSLLLEEEQEKLKSQRELLKSHFEKDLGEMQKQYENDYRIKLDQEILLAEERLRRQFEAEQVFYEKEMRERFANQYEQNLRELGKRTEDQEAALAERQKKIFAEKERELKDQYESRLTEETKRNQSLLDQQRAEQDHLKERLAKEFDEKLAVDRATLQQEHEKQKSSLSSTFDTERLKIEREYAFRMKEELERLKTEEVDQIERKRSEIEKELRAALESQLESERNQIIAESDAALERERQSFLERDREMKEQYKRRLLEELRKAESLILQQSQQQQKFAQDQLKQRMTREFDERLAHERESMRNEFNAQQETLHQSFEKERASLDVDYRQQLDAQIEHVRERELRKFESERVALTAKLERELKGDFNNRLQVELEQMRVENETALNAEREQIRLEREQMVANEALAVQKAREELKSQMDKQLLSRLEQVQGEYERKMDLLGISIPESHEQRLVLYRDRLRMAYVNGEPSVHQAWNVLELKELLELSYEEHVKIETEVRIEQYVQELESGIASGSVTPS